MAHPVNRIYFRHQEESADQIIPCQMVKKLSLKSLQYIQKHMQTHNELFSTTE